MEEFKIIPNYENYSISNYGTLKNNKTNRIMKTWLSNGYIYCRIINDNGHKKTTIHNLVALCFIGNRPDKADIDHKDRNKSNNHIENLHYCSKSENQFNKSIENIHRKANKLKEHHIHFNKGYYKVQIKHKYIGIKKTLEDAIILRNDFLKSITNI